MESTSHLDADTVRRLLAGDLPPAEARRWAAHLATDCDACEAVLADASPGPLDERVDVGLAGLAPGEPGNDLEYARIQRALRGAARPSRRGAAGARRWTPFAAVAAVALLAGGVAFQVVRAPDRRADWTGEKGRSAQPVPARLRFAVAGGEDLQRGAAGQVLPSDASLLFRIEVGAPAYVTLLRVAGADREVVFTGRAERAGPLDVTVDGRPAAYPLRGLAGAQRFLLVAGSAPIGERELAEAVRVTGGAAARADRPQQWSLDVVEITVR